jgi:hypothetical protein
MSAAAAETTRLLSEPGKARQMAKSHEETLEEARSLIAEADRYVDTTNPQALHEIQVTSIRAIAKCLLVLAEQSAF